MIQIYEDIISFFAQLNSNFSTTKVISLTPNPDWIKSDAGKVLCFKIADRYIFQFTEVIFLKDGHVDFADTVLWTLGENTSSGHVFVLRPISDKTDNYFHTVRLYCYNDKIYGHYSNIYKDIEYFFVLENNRELSLVPKEGFKEKSNAMFYEPLANGIPGVVTPIHPIIENDYLVGISSETSEKIIMIPKSYQIGRLNSVLKIIINSLSYTYTLSINTLISNFLFSLISVSNFFI